MAEIPASTLGTSDSLSPAGVCSVYLWWCPLSFRVWNLSLPGAFLQPHTPQATFPGLSRVWTPSHPRRHQPGTWLESPNSSFFPASLALPKRARICSATECRTQRTGSNPTPSMFQMRHRGPEEEKVSQDHWLGGRGHGQCWTQESSLLFVFSVALGSLLSASVEKCTLRSCQVYY